MLKVATSYHTHLPTFAQLCKMLAARYASIWDNLTMNTKISVLLRLTFAIACLFLALGNKPPAGAQATRADVQQAIQLGQLSEFKDNQATINIQTQKQLTDLQTQQATTQAEVENIEGWEKGGFGVLTLLSVLAMFFQMRRKVRTDE
jgi:hypothetical protein